MSNSIPSTNMALIANGAELTRMTVASMMSNDSVRSFFAAPAARESVYQMFVMAVHARLDPAIRACPPASSSPACCRAPTNPALCVPTSPLKERPTC